MESTVGCTLKGTNKTLSKRLTFSERVLLNSCYLFFIFFKHRQKICQIA